MRNFACYALGAAIGAAATLLVTQHDRCMDKDLILNARAYVMRIRLLGAADKAAFLEKVQSDPAVNTEWRVAVVLNNAFGGAPTSEITAE